MITFGLIINPLAGIGGAVGLKGSDGMAVEAFRRGAEKKAMQRSEQALQCLVEQQHNCRFLSCPGEMGEQLLTAMGFSVSLVDIKLPSSGETCAADTREAARQMADAGVDVLIFAGGDGTARDILQALEQAGRNDIPVLGIPAGVKIHSAVYGVTPQASGEVLRALVSGKLVDIKESEVRDLDEEAFRQDRVVARHFGELQVPQLGHFVQAVKQGGVESEELVLADIAAYIREMMEDDEDVLYLIGSGKTTQAVMQELQLDNTLLGVDAVFQQQLVGQDLSEQGILALLDQYPRARAVLSVMGGQGHIIGRGNQQFSPQVLKRLGKKNVCLISSKSKLTALAGRPLTIDSGDCQLDKQWSGTIQVITGYRDQVVQNLR